MAEEIWKAVPGFEGFYEASSEGRVRSLDRYAEQRNRWGQMQPVLRPGRVMSPGPHLGGYATVSLYRDGARRPTLVHIVICETFKGPKPFPDAVVRHLDGDQENCRAANLQWGTQLENEMDKEAHGTRLRGEAHPTARLTVEHVLEIRRRIGEPQQNLADEFGCTFSNISAIQLRKSWRHV